MRFGATFQQNPPIPRTVELAQLAEQQGFGYVWLWDSHVLWPDAFPLFALMAQATSTIHLGPCVTNPATRDVTVTASALATLDLISGGRMEMGIGRGDSSRRVIGKPPVTIEHLEAACVLIRALTAGDPVTVDGTQVELKWAERAVPVWAAAYGPKALRMAGRIADGVILQLADPHLIRWFLGYVREGAREAGRDPATIQVMSAAPAYVSDDLTHARDQVRWFPALVSNHVVDLVKRYQPADLPTELTDYIKRRDHYDYQEHGQIGAEHAGFVTDEVVDRFCVIGSADACEAKLRELAAAGVTQFNIYDMSDDVAGVLRAFGERLVPALGGS